MSAESVSTTATFFGTANRNEAIASNAADIILDCERYETCLINFLPLGLTQRVREVSTARNAAGALRALAI